MNTPEADPPSSHLEYLIGKAIAGPDRVEQLWHCVGISPMHRALIHRLALLHLKKSFGPSHRILWSASRDWTDASAAVSRACRILWIDSKQWTGLLDADSKPSVDALDGLTDFRFQAPLRVIWCWNQPNWRDFLALTPWTATGVVYNLPSLKSWIGRSLNSGSWQPAVGASLLPSGSFSSNLS